VKKRRATGERKKERTEEEGTGINQIIIIIRRGESTRGNARTKETQGKGDKPAFLGETRMK
jgi:hypothetical protein